MSNDFSNVFGYSRNDKSGNVGDKKTVNDKKIIMDLFGDVLNNTEKNKNENPYNTLADIFNYVLTSNGETSNDEFIENIAKKEKENYNYMLKKFSEKNAENMTKKLSENYNEHTKCSCDAQKCKCNSFTHREQICIEKYFPDYIELDDIEVYVNEEISEVTILLSGKDSVIKYVENIPAGYLFAESNYMKTATFYEGGKLSMLELIFVKKYSNSTLGTKVGIGTYHE